jgi:hypothetical protein
LSLYMTVEDFEKGRLGVIWAAIGLYFSGLNVQKPTLIS